MSAVWQTYVDGVLVEALHVFTDVGPVTALVAGIGLACGLAYAVVRVVRGG